MWKTYLIDPVILTFDLSILKPCHFLRSLVIPRLNTLQSFVFELYAEDKQTNEQTDKQQAALNILLKPTLSVGVGKWYEKSSNSAEALYN